MFQAQGLLRTAAARSAHGHQLRPSVSACRCRCPVARRALSTSVMRRAPDAGDAAVVGTRMVPARLAAEQASHTIMNACRWPCRGTSAKRRLRRGGWVALFLIPLPLPLPLPCLPWHCPCLHRVVQTAEFADIDLEREARTPGSDAVRRYQDR